MSNWSTQKNYLQNFKNPSLIKINQLVSCYGAARLIKNADPGKHSCSGYDIEFDGCRYFSKSDKFGKNKIKFDANKSSSVHIDNKQRYILVLGKDPTQKLNNITFVVNS